MICNRNVCCMYRKALQRVGSVYTRGGGGASEAMHQHALIKPLFIQVQLISRLRPFRIREGGGGGVIRAPPPKKRGP